LHVFTRFAAALLAAASCLPVCAADRAEPRAAAGALDLRDWDFARDGIVNLSGEWQLAWGRFEDAAAPASPPRAGVVVPGAWNEVLDAGRPVGSFGHATYRLTVDCRTREPLALVLPLQHSAARYYVNGRLAAVQGSPGGTPELARAGFLQQIAPIEATCPLQLVVHVSNHEMRQGGLLRSVELGSEREVLLRRERGLARDLFVLGGVVVLSLLPILFWFGRREDRAPLWVGIYGLTSSVFLAVGGERPLQPWFAPLGWEACWKIILLSSMIGLAAFPAFLRELYGRYFPRLAFRALLAAVGAFMLLIALTPARVYTQAVPAMYLLSALVGFGALVVLLRAALGGRGGAWLMLAGVVVLLGTVVHDMLQFSHLLQTKLTPFGLLAFSVAPAALLARRVGRALHAEELRTVEQSQRVDLLVSATKAGLLDWDAVAKRTVYSERLKEMLGHARDADTSAWPSLLERVHPEDRERIRASYARNMADRSVKSGVRRWRDSPDFRVLTSEGGYLWLSGEAISITDAEGRTLRHICSFIDISERKRQELELAERIRFSENLVALNKAIVAQAPSAIFVKDREGRFTLVNRGWTESFGFSAEETIGRTVHELFPGEDAARYEAEDQRLIAQGPSAAPVEALNEGPKPGQYRIVRKAVLSQGDAVVGLVCSSTDITELKRMELALESEQRRLDLVVRAQQVGIVDWDGRTHSTYYSPRFRQILGHAPDADTSGWPDYFKVLIHPEDRERITTRWRAFVTGRSEEGRGNYYLPEEYRLLRADGSYVWVEVGGVAVRDEKGFVVRWIAAVTDVTGKREQREALARQRERLELLVRATKAGFMDWDAVADTRTYSARFKEMLGYAPDADTAGWPSLFDMMHPDDREGMRDAFRDMLRQGAASGERMHGPLEYRLRKADGSYLWVRGEGIARIGEDGRTERFLTSYVDITHLREMNLALEESVRLREEVDRIGRHDLKTPLSSIIGFSRLLRDTGRFAADDARLLGFIEQSGYRLLNMVNLSLDMLQMEQGSYRFTPAAVDLHDVLEKVARDLASHLKAKNLAFRVEGPRAYALAEDLLCYSLFANLARNAIEASPDDGAGRGAIEVTIAEAGDNVEIRMRNAGAVPAAVRERFFDKYSTAGKAGGSGLGTYSARLMARTQEGDIAMATDGSHTTLTVTLRRAEAPQVPAQAAPPEGAGAPAGDTAPLSVLVVDDDEYTRIFVQQFLGSARSRTARNGREGLEAVQADPPDAVVMDLDMPVMGGLEAAAKIRQWEAGAGRARCAMIAMSSDDDPSVPERCLMAGFDRFIPKPVSPDALRRALVELTREPPRAGPRAAMAAPEAADDAPGATVRVRAKLKDALPGFLDSRRALAQELEQALRAGDAAKARAHAHKLAGSLALYGFRWAAGQGKMIEKRAGTGALSGLAAEAAALRRHLETVKVEIAE
jgi:PAS domain S-box-containing protein